MNAETAAQTPAQPDERQNVQALETEDDSQATPPEGEKSVNGERRPEQGEPDEWFEEEAPRERLIPFPAPPRKRFTLHRMGRRILGAVILLCVVGCAVCACLFCWQKWWRFDDEADICGSWKVVATGDSIVFDSRELKLTKSISYDYRLDTDAKTITYTFGQMEGGGHYYFSGDRQTLVIIDGDETLGLLAEAGFLPERVIANDEASDNRTVLTKLSNDTTAEPSGNGNGISRGNTNQGEREFVMWPDPVSSSSSGSKSSSSSRDRDNDEDANEYEDEKSSRSSSLDEDEEDETNLDEDAESLDGESTDEEDWIEDDTYSEDEDYSEDDAYYDDTAYDQEYYQDEGYE